MAVYRLPMSNGPIPGTIAQPPVLEGPWKEGSNWDGAANKHAFGQPFAFDYLYKDEHWPFYADVYAARAGFVLDARDDVSLPDPPEPPEGTSEGPGNYVFIQHADGTVMLYAHLLRNSVLVSPGQYVLQAEPLGLVDHSGSSSAWHLHFEALTRWWLNVLGPGLPPYATRKERTAGLISHFEDAVHPEPWRPRGNETVQPTALMNRQDGWRFCYKCTGLYFYFYNGTFSAESEAGVCPRGGPHQTQGGHYTLSVDPDDPGQPNWRWCSQCSGLFYGGQQNQSKCPATPNSLGPHDGSQSFDLRVVPSVPAMPGQHGWRFCVNCKGLWFFPAQASSKCPAQGFMHAPGMTNYALHHSLEDHQRGWRKCQKCLGLFFEPRGAGKCQAGGGHVAIGNIYTLCMAVSPINVGENPADFSILNAYGNVDWIGGNYWCHKCNLLFRSSVPTACPVKGLHSAQLSSEYWLVWVWNCPGKEWDTSCEGGLGERAWRACLNCGSIFHAPAGEFAGGKCAKNNVPHLTAQTGWYALINDDFIGQ